VGVGGGVALFVSFWAAAWLLLEMQSQTIKIIIATSVKKRNIIFSFFV
jgi:hypothetical protein